MTEMEARVSDSPINRTRDSAITLDRRTFVKATGAGLAAGALALGGGPAIAAPSRGGHLRFGVGAGAATDSLDPGTADQSFTQILMMGCNNYLTEITPSGDLVGELAESWEPSAEADTWIFNLRKGVEFHNGKTVEAQDVVSSLNHHRGEESKSAGKSLLDAVTELRADGKDKVVFELAGGNSDFPFVLAQYTFPVQPAQGDTIDWRSGIGVEEPATSGGSPPKRRAAAIAHPCPT